MKSVHSTEIAAALKRTQFSTNLLPTVLPRDKMATPKTRLCNRNDYVDFRKKSVHGPYYKMSNETTAFPLEAAIRL